MGYRDSDDSGFSRHGMNRDSDHYDPQQHGTQRSHRSGYDHPDLDRDEDLRTSHSVPLDSRQGRNEPYAGRRDGQPGYQGHQGYQGARGWEGRDRYQGQGGSGYSAGYGYGARSPDIGGYDPYESEQRYRQQQYGGGGYYGPGERSRLNRPEGWAREGYGAYDRDQYQGDTGYGQRQGRSYGYGYDGRPDGGGGYGYAQDDRQDRFAGGSSYGDHQQGNQARYGYGSNHNGNQRHDPDYAAWRQEQLRALDEDYDSWRNERYQKFSDEFNTWRSSRSRNQGNDLRGSNQSDQVTASGSSKNPQGTTATHAGSTASSGNKAKD